MRGHRSERAWTRRLTYSNVAATLALVMAMGGTAFAAATIGSADVIDGSLRGIDVKNNTLKSADIDKNAIGRSELGKNAVTSSRIKNGSIRLADLHAETRAVVVREIDVTVPKPASVGENRVTLVDAGSLVVEAACLHQFDLPTVASVSFPRPAVASTLVATDGSVQVLLPSYQNEASDHSVAALFPSSEYMSYVLATEAGRKELQVHLKLTAGASECTFSGVITELRG